MKRKDIEKAFTELSFDEMSPLLESLTAIHNTKKEARIKELEEEMARLRGELVVSRRAGRRADRRVAAQRKDIAAGNGSAAQPKRAALKPKYKDPASGRTWTGRGGTPKWMKAYEAEGRGRDEFLIG